MSETHCEAQRPEEIAPLLGTILHSDHFPSGERARLKRVDLRTPAPLAFYRLIERYAPQMWKGETHSRQWKVVIAATAMQHQNPHDPGRSFGSAMKQMGVSEFRLESLLSSRSSVRLALVLRIARRLAAARTRCDWREVTRFVFATSAAEQERVNSRVARDYYRTEHDSEAPVPTSPTVSVEE